MKPLRAPDATDASHAREVVDAFVELVAERSAELVLERLAEGAASSPYLNVEEAAVYLRCWTTKDGEDVPDKQRIYDLLSAGRLKRYKDGSRVLLLRSELDEHVARALPPSSETRIRRVI